ncbi:MAG: DMT family transporter [Bryobacteraceae bacterium]|nr:DMT family transporter [Bryobacteraceae bacterium]
MAEWLPYSLIAVALWGAVGLLQKLGASRVSAHSLFVWLTIGFALQVPFLAPGSRLASMAASEVGFGLLVGLTNALGSWFLFAALERGAQASIAIPLTALYPLVTALLAVLLLGERLSGRQWVGLVLAVIAGLLLSYEAPQQPDRSAAGSASETAG